MNKMSLGLVVLLAAASARADMGMLKMKMPQTKKQAGVVTALDEASLKLAVTEDKKVSEMSFAVDVLTQFKADKKTLVGKPVLVVYIEKDGKHLARAVAAPEKAQETAAPAPAPAPVPAARRE